jgi:hypothetical protein
LAKNDFRIIRYDQFPARTGSPGKYHAHFEEFGIRETNSVNSVGYCEAYNRTVDKALLVKFGAAYARKRGQILPPQGAKSWFETHSRKSGA